MPSPGDLPKPGMNPDTFHTAYRWILYQRSMFFLLADTVTLLISNKGVCRLPESGGSVVPQPHTVVEVTFFSLVQAKTLAVSVSPHLCWSHVLIQHPLLC